MCFLVIKPINQVVKLSLFYHKYGKTKRSHTKKPSIKIPNTEHSISNSLVLNRPLLDLRPFGSVFSLQGSSQHRTCVRDNNPPPQEVGYCRPRPSSLQHSFKRTCHLNIHVVLNTSPSVIHICFSRPERLHICYLRANGVSILHKS